MAKSTSRPIFRQCLAGCTANLVAVTTGCLFGWTSPTLPKLQLPGAFLHPTPEQGSWIGSLLLVGAAIGPFPAGYLADKIGRKWTLLVLVIPLLISWTLITAAQNIAMIYVGRFIGGIAMGAAYTVAPMYTGEIAENNIRGSLASTSFFLASIGYLNVNTIGPFVSYVWLGIACTAIPILFAVTFFFAPETPYYLLSKGKKEEASKALQWLRNSTEEGVEPELIVMEVFVSESFKNAGTLKDLFATRGNIKALFLSCSIVGFQILSGIDVVLFYSTTIFTLSGGSLSDELSTIVVGVIMLTASVVAPLFVDKIGRKPMLYASAFGMAAAEFFLGLYFYYKDVEGKDLSFVGWLPVLCLVLYMSLYSIGYGPLPWVIMGELFPANVKGMASALTASSCWFLGFLVTKFFQNIVDVLGIHVAFWMYSGFCVLSNVFVFLLLPETKGKSFQEIQDILNKY